MPHKHKRRQDDKSIYDLPPTEIAKSLPVYDPNSKSWKTDKNKKNKNNKNNKNKKPLQNAKGKPIAKPETSRKATAMEDDTPKAFLRLMQRQTQRNQGPSNPSEEAQEPAKKRKRESGDKTNPRKKSATKTAKKPTTTTTTAAAAATTTTDTEPTAPASSAPETQPKLKILPGEKLSDFAARVDRELPLSMMKKSDKPAAAGMPNIREQRQTKHEKHLRRLQKQWREDEKKIQEREAEEREEREDEREEETRQWREWELEAGKAKAKKKGAGKKGKNQNGEDYEPDPWAKLNKARMNKQSNPSFDVVEAPPQLTKPREIFKVRGGAMVNVANVPAAVGSLRQREELATERNNIVEEYRRLMAEKRQS
ncbi:hypothetical protein FE257_001647 [Aspergillus nanangensis]|uniref:Urease accessory protein UreD n=1 Tax=Aspergillus nanangensis TaxID=2582783 RepID=A0AAD4CU84_ASPNN|nr:hypothetical protein FE257_001647 [Aspergillus nanangensis]